MRKIILFALFVALAVQAEDLFIETPCFDVDVEVAPQYSLELKGVRDNDFQLIIDRGGLTSHIRTTFCGIGDWVIESRIGADCFEIIDGQRHLTGDACTWQPWKETVTAAVSKLRPGSPTFLVKLDKKNAAAE